MRWLSSLAILVACAGDDDRDLRPPGGGGGTGNDEAPDAANDLSDGGVTAVAGRICVITDFQAPAACPDDPLARDVLVEDAAVDGGSTRSDDAGTFELAVSGLPVLVDVASESGDLLFTTRTTVTSAADVDLPAVDDLLFEDALLTLQESLSQGAQLVYVVDVDGPVEGATVTGGGAGARIYYDDGVGGWDGNATSTGPDGIALVLDATSATLVASVDARTATATVETATQTIGVGVITLPAR
jgi:hypothetical protein